VIPPTVPPLTPLHVVHAFASVGRYGAGDRGVDLAGTPGETVVSATAGVVSFAGPVAGQGVVSVRIGGGRVVTYEPVTPAVATGDVVAAGSPLGRLAGGHLGCPAAACLHWGLRLPDGTYADPLTLLGPPRVRLLPLPGSAGPASPVAPAVGGGAAALGAIGAAARRARSHLRS
jgi:murein DD-endopeptidase MepM/ murein hydrolase activator NlpD